MKIKYECFDCGEENFTVEVCPVCGSTNTCEIEYDGGDFDRMGEDPEEEENEESDIS